MNICGDASKKEANYIVVPEGDLSHAEIALLPKSPAEKVFYEILFYKRLEDNDSIVSMTYNLGDTSLTLENLEMFGKSFRFLLGGGILGNKDIVQFTLTTKNGEERQLNVTVVIAPAGIAQAPFNKDYVIGNKGEKGDKDDTGATGAAGPAGLKGDKGDTGADGTSATINAGTTITGDVGTQAKVTNSGDSSNAIFDFTIPKGKKGDKNDIGVAGAACTNDGTINLDVKTIKSDGGKIMSNGTGELTINTLTSDGGKITSDGIGNLTVDEGIETGLIQPPDGKTLSMFFDELIGYPSKIASDNSDSILLVHNAYIFPPDDVPVGSDNEARGFFILSDGNFCLANGYTSIGNKDKNKKSYKAAPPTDYDYVISVGKDTKLAAIKNIKTNTKIGCAYSLIDHSGITITSLAAEVLAYNKATNLPKMCNGIK